MRGNFPKWVDIDNGRQKDRTHSSNASENYRRNAAENDRRRRTPRLFNRGWWHWWWPKPKAFPMQHLLPIVDHKTNIQNSLWFLTPGKKNNLQFLLESLYFQRLLEGPHQISALKKEGLHLQILSEGFFAKNYFEGSRKFGSFEKYGLQVQYLPKGISRV